MLALKRLVIIVLLAALLGSAVGCGGSEKPAGEATDPGTEASEPTSEETDPASAVKMPVVDRNGVRLGEIDSRANCSAADAGIFYSIFALENYEFTATAEYRFFNKEDHTDVLLGRLEGQGYEAYYARTELNGSIYTLAVQGMAGGEGTPLLLLAFDPAGQTMKTFTVSENGFPYADMAAVNGKLLIMSHELSEKKDVICEFDPSSEALKQVLSFSSDTDSLRGICSADSGFYLLRLKIGDAGENEMFVDLYGSDYGKTSEQSVNETMVDAIMTIPGMLGRQDALNEIGMNVVHFSVEEGRYLLYENLGMARIIADLKTGETILAKNDLYSVSLGSGTPAVYRMDYDNDNIQGPEILILENGSLTAYAFQPINSHRLIRRVSRSGSGTWMILTSDDFRSFCWTLAAHLWTES